MEKKMRRFLAMLLLLAFFAGCSSKEDAVVVKGYFFFNGNTKNIAISIDKGQRFGVVAGQTNLYAIVAGSHTIDIYRGDLMILSRTFIVREGLAKEIVIE
jgi:hypothetical protein